MTPDPHEPPARTVGGRYRLLTSIGRGGMGVVWAAHDDRLDREVAVKEVTFPASLEEPQRVQLRGRTLREARAAARISTPAAVTVYDVVEEDGRPWIVMELLPARSLADVLREEGPLDADAAARLGLRLLEALDAAHAAGVLHRDVKPANVLYDGTGQAVLTDFGIASLEGDSSHTTTGVVVGSPGYVAPERAHGRPPSPASDLWSLGVTLATALHGRSPFERDTAMATLVAAVQDPLPEQVRGGPLGDVITALLRKDPAARPGPAEVRDRLTAALSSGPGADGSTAATDETTPLPGSAAGPPAGADAGRTQALPSLPPAPATGPSASSAPRPAPATDPRPPRPAPRPTVLPARPAVRPAGPEPRPARPAVSAARPGARPGAPAPPRRSRVLPVLVAVAALLVAGVALAVLLDRPEGTDLATDPGAPPAATAEAAATAPPIPATGEEGATGTPGTATPDAGTPEADESGTAGAAADATAADAPPAPADPGAVPDGFQLHEDPAYQVAVPDGWVVEPDGDTRTRFTDPGSRRYLLVEEGGEPAGDPVADWEQQEPAVAERLDGYERIGIAPGELGDFDVADWQFTWEPSGGTLQVLNRAVVADDQAFALYWSVPQEEWEDSLGVLDDIAGSFRPVG